MFGNKTSLSPDTNGSTSPVLEMDKYGSNDSVNMKTSRTHLAGESIGGNESWWSRRSTTEKRLLVILGLFVIGAIALAAAVGVFVNKNNDLTRQLDGHSKEISNLSPSTSKSGEPSICTSPDCVLSAALILDAMNASVDPCDDFFKFACGNWIKNNPIPDDKDRCENFNILEQKVKQQYKELLSPSSSENEIKAINKTKSMYQACIEEEKVWALTYPRVLDALNDYGGWPIANSSVDGSAFDWIQVEAAFIREPSTPTDYTSSLVEFYVYFDTKNTSRNIIYINQPTLGLAQGYLLHPHNYSKQIEAYKRLITGVATYFANGTGVNIEDQVNQMVELETAIANISMTPSDKRHKERTYNKMTISELQANTSQSYSDFDWLKLVNEIYTGIWIIEGTEPIIISDLNYTLQLGPLLNTTDKRVLSNYMLWRYLFRLLPHISSETRDLYNDFQKIMTGVSKPVDRWQLCAAEVDSGMGMALGRLYVEQFFKVSSKDEALAMIKEIQETFTSMLDEVKWMDDATRKAAKEKASEMVNRIGYPDWILDEKKLNDYYENVSISQTDHAANLRCSAVSLVWKSLHSLRDQPADKTILSWTPGTVNAHYDSEVNSINFPAGILQTPFFQVGRMKALNFGAIGAIIGHEITHGFDDEGRQSDKHGNLVEWWSPSVVPSFQKKTECYVEQYGKYCSPTTDGSETCIDGKNTLGENIADNGGIKAAFEAYRKWVGKQPGEELLLPGLEKYTPDQLFYLSFGQIWCANIRPESLLNQMLTDPHSPEPYRIIGTVSNSKHFAEVYKCPAGKKMNRGDDRCELW